MIYMDHSATTPVREEVFEIMKPYFTRSFGNASTFYSLGREAKEAMENARENVASIIGANKDEIIFTSGGTESDNITIQGIAYKLNEMGKGNHIITSSIEHPAVMETCAVLEKKGFEVTYLPVYEEGIVKIEDLKNAIKEETILITIMHANNEIGTLQPVNEIGKIAKENKIKFHTDAVQSVGKIPVDVNEMNVDLLSISSHKIYGPKGIGALYIKKGTRLQPILFGGGQEKDLSPGTENIVGIVGLGEACRLAKEELEKNISYVTNLRDKLIDGVLNSVEKSYINGDKNKRLPGNVNFRFTGIEGESIVLMLDAKGITSSTGSACSSTKLTASHVLKAIGLENVDSHGSLRLTIGPENTEEEVKTVIKEIPPIIEKLRSLSSIWNKDESIWENNTKSCDI
ncbi:Cysteine desulfurase IscS 2 [Candidatus Methanobinarius endosymbioticus]|uniref:Cysteine desulfurase IscS n=1 Tax=Candidatus Methanobinarius endosymbioticus TaxID=2006182 RepID=A0A366MAL9_9EURY|nr:Cysteine desulfurase IscS 2 [Candidatus Methanobinarius endosymbioticus]